MKTKNAPHKKIQKTPTGKKANRLDYVEDKEEYDMMKLRKDQDMWGKAADIGEAMMRAKIGYGKKTRVKGQPKKGGY